MFCGHTRPHLACFHGAHPNLKAREVREKNLLFRSGNMRALPAFPYSRAELPHGVSYISLHRALFLPRARHLREAFSREIVHLWTGQCGCQMGKKTCVDTTAKLLPQASVLALRAAGANQLLKPASTTPRRYGRRHRPWHHGHVHATHHERRCGKQPVHHDQVHAWRLGTSRPSQCARATAYCGRAEQLHCSLEVKVEVLLYHIN
jgi:hypothetical protein